MEARMGRLIVMLGILFLAVMIVNQWGPSWASSLSEVREWINGPTHVEEITWEFRTEDTILPEEIFSPN